MVYTILKFLYILFLYFYEKYCFWNNNIVRTQWIFWKLDLWPKGNKPLLGLRTSPTLADPNEASLSDHIADEPGIPVSSIVLDVK